MRETIKISDLVEEYKEWYKQEYEEEFDNNFDLKCLSNDSETIEILEKSEHIIELDHLTLGYTVIFKRISDGKFFKVEWTKQGYDYCSLEEEIAKEVFPETITKVIYK